MKRRGILILCALLGAASCRPMELYFVKPQGPPEYQLGWQDGCDTGVSAYSTVSQRLVLGFNKRPELGSSEQYKSGWNEGFTYCRFVSDKNHAIEADIRATGMWWEN